MNPPEPTERAAAGGQNAQKTQHTGAPGSEDRKEQPTTTERQAAEDARRVTINEQRVQDNLKRCDVEVVGDLRREAATEEDARHATIEEQRIQDNLGRRAAEKAADLRGDRQAATERADERLLARAARWE